MTATLCVCVCVHVCDCVRLVFSTFCAVRLNFSFPCVCYFASSCLCFCACSEGNDPYEPFCMGSFKGIPFCTKIGVVAWALYRGPNYSGPFCLILPSCLCFWHARPPATRAPLRAQVSVAELLELSSACRLRHEPLLRHLAGGSSRGFQQLLLLGPRVGGSERSSAKARSD